MTRARTAARKRVRGFCFQLLRLVLAAVILVSSLQGGSELTCELTCSLMQALYANRGLGHAFLW